MLVFAASTHALKIHVARQRNLRCIKQKASLEKCTPMRTSSTVDMKGFTWKIPTAGRAMRGRCASQGSDEILDAALAGKFGGLEVPDGLMEALKDAMARQNEAEKGDWEQARALSAQQIAAAQARSAGFQAPADSVDTSSSPGTSFAGAEDGLDWLAGPQVTAQETDECVIQNVEINLSDDPHSVSFALELLQNTKRAAYANYTSMMAQRKAIDECINRSKRTLEMLDAAIDKVGQDQAYYRTMDQIHKDQLKNPRGF
mmetsp:Transcript_17395/g.33488  ORF Transcript_17395/g.33488 Transcript_17395/m.33488 type:complete len:258 (+) Transcript_17395:109-882(+)|eukprot:CAMPEP_0114226890 /NCGR_PEP_ID=MMETSP0058-20121206/1485_1 /TAXON_ID=36894 /ORGANISM="Pyramimonas parkeae, CCMP726" /LENGTH=257 /DNA_ID=CAMNT_0001337669 /DNA_START=88 /DNA_END=861 /DNA_ORIENTATION=+